MKRSFNKKKNSTAKSNGFGRKDPSSFKAHRPVFKPKIEKVDLFKEEDDMRLNKYVALCGIASRRGAADLIKDGLVTVNGEVTMEIGQRITAKDVITYQGKVIKPIEQLYYILLNKPKDTITTVNDEKGRKTVMDIVRKTIKARIYPVGRLDRDTTGLLLLTNDGDLAQKMAHPSYKIKKIYQASLDRALSREDLEHIKNGVELEDGIAEVDAINYVESAPKTEVLIEIHIGKNRIVRRIFEQLGYNVMKLDRVYYGGLTKKDLPRSTYRQLTEREVIMLKHFSGK
jgi:23S rRNA pseudouridine2605 synthase